MAANGLPNGRAAEQPLRKPANALPQALRAPTGSCAQVRSPRAESDSERRRRSAFDIEAALAEFAEMVVFEDDEADTFERKRYESAEEAAADSNKIALKKMLNLQFSVSFFCVSCVAENYVVSVFGTSGNTFKKITPEYKLCIQKFHVNLPNSIWGRDDSAGDSQGWLPRFFVFFLITKNIQNQFLSLLFHADLEFPFFVIRKKSRRRGGCPWESSAGSFWLQVVFGRLTKKNHAALSGCRNFGIPI